MVMFKLLTAAKMRTEDKQLTFMPTSFPGSTPISFSEPAFPSTIGHKTQRLWANPKPEPGNPGSGLIVRVRWRVASCN